MLSLPPSILYVQISRPGSYCLCHLLTISRSHNNEQSLYTLSELAQHLVKSFAERHTWPLTTLPKSTVAVKLPGDAFKAIGDPAKAKEIAKTAYVSEDVLKELGVKEKKVGPGSSL